MSQGSGRFSDGPDAEARACVGRVPALMFAVPKKICPIRWPRAGYFGQWGEGRQTAAAVADAFRADRGPTSKDDNWAT